MRLIFLLIIILLSSCNNKKDTIVNRQQAIMKEMENVKAAYFKTSDSLQSLREVDTNSVKQHEIEEQLVKADGEKSVNLTNLLKEYDSLEVELKKY